MSDYRNVPVYRGPVKACVFDWAGTVCDSGVFAPVLAFQKLFEDEGVPITSDEVRGPMGVHKRVHIQKVLETATVKQRWTEKKGAAPTVDDIERIYRNSLTSTLDVLPANSHVLEGIPETMEILRSKYGIKIGSSTGYTKEIMEMLKPLASAEGYTPDAYVTSDEVVTARPSPAMVFLNMIRLDVWNAAAVVKVDDTDQGIIAGLHAGCWTVGVAKTGNYVGATEGELKAMDPAELETKLKKARKILFECGCHFVVDTVNELPGVVEEINRRLAMGLRP